MAKIICPNESYTGVAASVSFVDGKGETEDKDLITWFKANGYEVLEDGVDVAWDAEEDKEASYADMPHKDLQALAKEKGLSAAGSKEDIIARLEGAEDEERGDQE